MEGVKYDFEIVSIGDGMLFGATFYGRDDVLEEDWAEFNLYLGIVKLKWRWF
jgi:hypothetical protein